MGSWGMIHKDNSIIAIDAEWCISYGAKLGAFVCKIKRKHFDILEDFHCHRCGIHIDHNAEICNEGIDDDLVTG
jgi:hypothetical protein